MSNSEIHICMDMFLINILENYCGSVAKEV